MTRRCLYCYQPLVDAEKDFHQQCSRRFFGTAVPPVLEYDNAQMQELAKEIVLKSVAVTGVQPKLSLSLEKMPGDPRRSRLTIVGLWGHFILKPPNETYPFMPENEDLTMHLAEIYRIPVAEHSLIRLGSGELAYITKRFDRTKTGKLALEDMCQVTETLTADKYRSSMEKVGKKILQYSSRPGLDAITFFEIALQSYLTGNADMHLKNFSLLTTPENAVVLSPAYDLISSKLVLKEDLEEMALTINAKKAKLKRKDFDKLAESLKIPERAVSNVYAKFKIGIDKVYEMIDISFLPDVQKDEYKNIIASNAHKLELM